MSKRCKLGIHKWSVVLWNYDIFYKVLIGQTIECQRCLKQDSWGRIK